MLDFSLLKLPTFNLISVLGFLVMLGYFIPFAFMNVRAEIAGIDSGKAALLISILGKR